MYRVTFVVILALIPFVVSAHGAGASFERDVGNYRIDIGYDPAAVHGGDRLVLHFGALQHADGTPADFDYVWVRMRYEEGETVLATSITRADVGPTSLLMHLPEDTAGDLVIHVRYQKGEESLAETEFKLPVSPLPGVRPHWILPIAGVLLGMCIGTAGAFFFTRRRIPMVH